MGGSKLTLCVVVEKSSDFDSPTMKIASKDKVFEIDAVKLPPSSDIGSWVAGRSNDFEVFTETKRIPMGTRLEDGKVQLFSYVAVPFGHCSIRDGFTLPEKASVWSPHLGYAFSEKDMMLGLREEILYEAWFEYRSDWVGKEPIWELKQVGQPLIDPAKTILLKQTPWKLLSKKAEVRDASLSAVLNAERREWDGYHNGLVVAFIDNPEPAVILYSRSYGGIVTANEKRVLKSVYRQLAIGQMAKFRERTDPITNEKYADIKETIYTTRKDIRFEIKKDKRLSYQAIKILSSVAIDDDLLEEGEGSMNLLSAYGPVTVSRDTFAKQLEGAFLKREDMEKAREEGKELRVWILFVPVTSMWSLSHIDKDWFTHTTPS